LGSAWGPEPGSRGVHSGPSLPEIRGWVHRRSRDIIYVMQPAKTSAACRRRARPSDRLSPTVAGMTHRPSRVHAVGGLADDIDRLSTAHDHSGLSGWGAQPCST
jgi:hypothetical protein